MISGLTIKISNRLIHTISFKIVMSKKLLITIIISLLIISFAVIAVSGSKYTASYVISWQDADGSAQVPDDYYVTADEQGIVDISNIRLEGNSIKFDLTALDRGITFIKVGEKPDSQLYYEKVYVHRFNIITLNSFFGKCTGGVVIPISFLIILLILFIDRIRILRANVGENIYSYRNIMNLGLIVFVACMIFQMATIILRFNGIDQSIKSVLASAEFFAYIALPVAFVVSLLVSLSNLNLMRNEGVNWRNMLGFILGLFICLMTVMPDQLYNVFMRTQVIDIFNERGIATQIYSVFEHSVFYIVAYLECILIGAVVFGIKAARHIPAFNKDYILILGCQIRPDGTLTPLLQSRTDRAMEFADMQMEAAGKDITFVPSGGKGGDEIIAEADAIGNYLRSKGITDDRILIENKSQNTYENIRNSAELIKADFTKRAAPDVSEEPKVAFSTTNYHVFRAGLIASELGYQMEGIGSPTKIYFWINAFIREFIATLVSERKSHLKVIITLLLGVIVLVIGNYISVIL